MSQEQKLWAAARQEGCSSHFRVVGSSLYKFLNFYLLAFNKKRSWFLLFNCFFSFWRYLIKFLAKLAQNSDVNKMTPSNIAIVLGPNLLWAKNEGWVLSRKLQSRMGWSCRIDRFKSFSKEFSNSQQGTAYLKNASSVLSAHASRSFEAGGFQGCFQELWMVWSPAQLLFLWYWGADPSCLAWFVI